APFGMAVASRDLRALHEVGDAKLGESVFRESQTAGRDRVRDGSFGKVDTVEPRDPRQHGGDVPVLVVDRGDVSATAQHETTDRVRLGDAGEARHAEAAG